MKLLIMQFFPNSCFIRLHDFVLCNINCPFDEFSVGLKSLRTLLSKKQGITDTAHGRDVCCTNWVQWYKMESDLLEAV
jgi:hypothetical protein